MKISHLAMNLRGPWMITPEMAAAMAPVLKGVLRGYITEFEKGPEPYKLSCDTVIPAPSGKQNQFAGKSIYVTNLSGTLLKYDSCEAYGTSTIGRQLLEADADPEIIGHIIVTESGGGAANAVPEIAEAISACQKPVVAWVDGIAASAAIYSVSYCDRIIAHRKEDIVGSIGTLIEISGKPLYHKNPETGEITARIYADAATDKNAEYERALEHDFQLIKDERLNPTNEKFIRDMKANRPALTEEHLTGKTFPAGDAVGTFVDAIGGFDAAVKAVLDLAQEKQTQQTQSQSSMKEKLPFLMAIAAMAELVFSEDGSATLQAVQFEAIEEALKTGNGLQATIDGLRQQLSDAQATAEQHSQTIAQRDARIQELETSLAAAQELIDNPAPAGMQVNHTPAAEGEIQAAKTFDEALAVCQNFLKK